MGEAPDFYGRFTFTWVLRWPAKRTTRHERRRGTEEASLPPFPSSICPGSCRNEFLSHLRVDFFFFLPEWLKQWLKPPACRHTNTHSVLTQVWTLIVVVDVVMDFYGADLIWSFTWGAQPHTLTHTHRNTFIHAFIHLRHLKHDANCLYPYFVFNSFLLLLFYLYFVAYCIEESYIDLHTKHLSLPLLFKLYPMRNKKRTLLLLYHTTVLLTIKLFSH